MAEKYYKGNNIGLTFDGTGWKLNNLPQNFINPEAFSTKDPVFPKIPTTPEPPSTEPEKDPCPPGYVFDKALNQCVPDPNYQNPFRQDNQGGGNEQPFQPGTGKELPKGVNYNSNSLFPYSTDAPTRAQQNEHMLLQSGISLGWLEKDGNGNYVKVPFKVQAGDMTGIGWGGMAIKYFNEKSYNDYFNVLENGWQPEGKGLWDKFLRGNSVYSLKGGMKKTTMSGPGGMDMEVYNYSPKFQEKINQAQSITGGMIDRDGNVNINADGKGGYYREDGKFVLNNGQVVSFGSLSAGLNYVSKLQGSGLKLSKTLRDRLAKGIDSVNFNSNMLPEGFTKESLKNIINTYKQEKQTQTDVDLGITTEETKDDGSTDVSTVGEDVVTAVGGDISSNTPDANIDPSSPTYTQDNYEQASGVNQNNNNNTPVVGPNPGDAGGSTSSGSSSSNQQDTNAPNYPGNQSYTPPPSSAAESFKQYGRF